MSRHFGGVPTTRRADRAKMLLALGAFLLVVCSGLVVLLLYTGSSRASVSPVNVEPAPALEMVDVLVPLRSIEAGVALEASMFRKESRPKLGLAPRVIKDFEEIKGHFSRSLIVPDQPLYGDYITQVRPNSPITASIPEGYRAVTIRVDATSSVEGWARPGASVDVVWASMVRGRQAVTVIVQNAKILSAERQVDANTVPGAPVPSTVTLLVRAEDSAKIQLAQTTGSLSLSLRGDTDVGKGVATGSITLEDLYGGSPQQKPDEHREGTVRFKKPDGTYDELVLKDGKLSPSGK